MLWSRNGVTGKWARTPGRLTSQSYISRRESVLRVRQARYPVRMTDLDALKHQLERQLADLTVQYDAAEQETLRLLAVLKSPAAEARVEQWSAALEALEKERKIAFERQEVLTQFWALASRTEE